MTRRPSPFRPGASSCFTLVEMLVAVTVLAMIVLVTARLVSITSRTILADGKKIDSLSQTRQALDRFGLDWNARIARPDMALNLLKQGGNDAVSFVSQMPSPTGSRSLAVVGYRVNGNASATGSNYRLERGTHGFDWSGGNPVSFPLATVPALADADFQPLSEGVFRLEICVLNAASSTNAAVLTPNPAANPLTTTANCAAVLVAVATLDNTSRKLIGSAQMQALAAALADPTAANPDPVTAWKAALNRADFASTANVPPGVAQAVRVDERYFYVNFVP